MLFENEALAAKFTVPDTITVKMRLAYIGVLGNPPAHERYERALHAAAEVIDSFTCEKWPQPGIDVKQIDAMTQRQITRATLGIDLDQIDAKQYPDAYLIAMWIGGTVAGHMAALDELPKN